MGKLRKYKSLYSSTTNTFSTGEAVTITPASVVGLPTDTEITLTFDRVDSSGAKTPSKMERIRGTIVGSNFVVSSGGRAVEGTEQTHTSPVVEMVWNAADWNDAVDSLSNVVDIDTGALDTTKVVDLDTEQTLEYKTLTSPVINTSVSGTAVLDEDDMASDSATKLATQQSIKAYVDRLNSASIYRQALFNPACEVYQLAAAVNLTSGKLFGGSDGFYAKGEGTAVSAGTIIQTTSANCGVSGFADKLSGVTLTGTGKVHAYRFIESIDAKLYKNQAASFGVVVYHDVGSAIDFTIKINKANSADDFSAVTNIATASAQSVPNTTETRIVFENINSGDLGDCSNGIEIEIEVDCGAITTKNFEFAEWQFNLGSTVLDFCCGDYEREFNICTVHFERHYIGASKLTPLQSLCNIDSGNRGEVYLHWSRKRKAPTVTLKTYANWIWSNITTGANVALSQQLQFYLGKDIYGGNAFASCSSLSTNTVVELTTSTAGEYIDYDARVTIA